MWRLFSSAVKQTLFFFCHLRLSSSSRCVCCLEQSMLVSFRTHSDIQLLWSLLTTANKKGINQVLESKDLMILNGKFKLSVQHPDKLINRKYVNRLVLVQRQLLTHPVCALWSPGKYKNTDFMYWLILAGMNEFKIITVHKRYSANI